MSVTTTQNPVTYSIVRTLQDYEVHHGGDGGLETDNIEPPNHRTGISHGPASRNVAGWESEYRRVPPPRPADQSLDFTSRNTYNDLVERFFISTMFGGIDWVQTFNKMWRATGGKLNDTYFRFPVGGEY